MIKRTKPITGRTVLIWMLSFFGVIIAVNGVFAYLALDSWPGLTTNKAYEEGLAYNDVLDAAARQKALGWQLQPVLGRQPGSERSLEISIRDKDGQPVSGLSVTAEFRRPVGTGKNVSIELKESGPGAYSGIVSLRQPGQWHLEVQAKGAAGQDFKKIFNTEVGA